ncbi:MAG: STAS domain-containing protein [Bacteroidota bacterium]
MEHSHEIESEILKLHLKGDLIGENDGTELLSVVTDTINDGIVYGCVDISEVRYINSSGIGVLITMLTKFRNKGGELVLLKPSDHVQKLLLITKLNNIFKIAEKEEEIEAFLKK